MLIFKALHILSMFTMVAVGVGGYSVYALAVGRRDIHALAAIHRTLARGRLVANVSALALLAGVVFGLLTALTAGLDFLTGWLINAYVLVAPSRSTRIGSGEGWLDSGMRQLTRRMGGDRAMRSCVRSLPAGPSATSPSRRFSSSRSLRTWSSSSDGLRVRSLLPLFPPRRGLAITWCPTLGAPDAAWSLK